ncbi:MAG: DEAD/DEAH box helicase [Saprospiraceae bacterium]|nr:DEAD/DEAH box helicase [Saprospiraceae bacterium]
MEDSTYILKKYWGYDKFRSPQDLIIDSVMKLQDTIALLPTGGGKSVCFQVPSMMFQGKTIVVSPLIALMQDQVDQLRVRNINAKSLHSNLTYQQIDPFWMTLYMAISNYCISRRRGSNPRCFHFVSQKPKLAL